MADPFSIVGIVEGSLSLIVQCGSVVKSLNDFAGKYKQAELSILSMAQEVDTIELAWKRIRQWIETCGENGLESIFVDRLNRSLECGTLVMSALQQDLSQFTMQTMDLKQRSKATWNESALRDHQHRIRGQAIAMGLLLQAVSLPTSTQRKELLRVEDLRLRESDESAYSIVPSRLSSCISLSTYASINSAELIHRRLSCENDLFTARVYKRNFKALLVNSLRPKPVNDYRSKARFHTGQISDIGSAAAARTHGRSEELLLIQMPRGLRSYTFDATSSRNLDLLSTPVMKILRHSANVDLTFHKAAELGQLSDIEILYAWGARASKGSGAEKWTPLHSAARGEYSEHSGVVDFLLRKGAKPKARTLDGLQPIHLSCKAGAIVSVRLLLDAGASPNCASSTGFRPLHFALGSDNGPEVIALLVSKGAIMDVECASGEARTPLQMACTIPEHVESVRVLLDSGAKADARSSSGYSALELAVTMKCRANVGLLLERGANPNVIHPLTSQASILMYASSIWSSAEFIRHGRVMIKLLEFGADAGMQDDQGNNILHYLAKYAWSTQDADDPMWRECIEGLVECGANPKTTNADGDTALSLAVMNLNIPLFKLLQTHDPGDLSLLEQYSLDAYLDRWCILLSSIQ